MSRLYSPLYSSPRTVDNWPKNSSPVHSPPSYTPRTLSSWTRRRRSRILFDPFPSLHPTTLFRSIPRRQLRQRTHPTAQPAIKSHRSNSLSLIFLALFLLLIHLHLVDPPSIAPNCYPLYIPHELVHCPSDPPINKRVLRLIDTDPETV